MSELISVENVYKKYRLGVTNRGMLYKDIQSWWARVNGKEDPNSKIEDHPRHQRIEKGDEFWALQDISFSIKAGETLGVIGRNGAGKSTLLKILSRTTSPTSGAIKARGRISSLLEVGTGFHPELTGRENVFLNGAILGMNRSEVSRKFDEIVAFSEVEEFIDTPVKRYSSGMYVRLAFSIAAFLESEVLILDEVLAVGDAKFQKKCLLKMRDVVDGGRTILFVSHNTHAIRSFCSRVLLLSDGIVTYDGPTSGGIDKYLSSLSNFTLTADDNLENRLLRTSGNLRFEGIECIHPDGKRGWKVPLGAEVTIHLKCRAHEPVESLGLFFGLLAESDGDMITNFKTPLRETKVESGSKISLDFKLDTSVFRPGSYLMYIAIGNADSTAFYDVIDSNVGLPPIVLESDNDDIHFREGYMQMKGEVHNLTVLSK